MPFILCLPAYNPSTLPSYPTMPDTSFAHSTLQPRQSCSHALVCVRARVWAFVRARVCTPAPSSSPLPSDSSSAAGRALFTPAPSCLPSCCIPSRWSTSSWASPALALPAFFRSAAIAPTCGAIPNTHSSSHVTGDRLPRGRRRKRTRTSTPETRNRSIRSSLETCGPYVSETASRPRVPSQHPPSQTLNHAHLFAIITNHLLLAFACRKRLWRWIR